MNNNHDLEGAASILAEGWFQRNHPESPGVTISDEQMAEAAYEVRAALDIPECQKSPSGRHTRRLAAETCLYCDAAVSLTTRTCLTSPFARLAHHA